MAKKLPADAVRLHDKGKHKGYLTLDEILEVYTNAEERVEELDDKHIVAQRLLEDGVEFVDSSLPCVLTVVKEINQPRIASLKGKMTAKKAVIEKWTAQDLGAEADKTGLDGSPTKVVKIFTPAPRQGGQMLKGTPDEVVRKLVEEIGGVITGAAK